MNMSFLKVAIPLVLLALQAPAQAASHFIFAKSTGQSLSPSITEDVTAQIENTISRHRSELNYCLDKALLRDKFDTGSSTDITFEINEEGKPTGSLEYTTVNVKQSGPAIDRIVDCIAHRIGLMVFPHFPGNMKVMIRFTFENFNGNTAFRLSSPIKSIPFRQSQDR